MTNESLKPITLEEQIKLLEIRIHELEIEKDMATHKDNRPFNHNSPSLEIGVGLSEEQHTELCEAVEHWFQQSVKRRQSPSVVFQKIFESTLPLREKMVMAYVLGVFIQDLVTRMKK